MFCVEVSSAKNIIHCGRLVNVKENIVLKRVSIIVDKGLIIEIRKGFVSGKGSIDLSQGTCLPGLIDLHVHFEQNFPKMMSFHHPDEARTLVDSLTFPEKNLMAGFTTVRDLASFRNITAQLKYGISNGTIVGPRIINAGHPISIPGGHGDPLDKLKTNGQKKMRDTYKNYYNYKFVSKPQDVIPWFEYYFIDRPKWYRQFKSNEQAKDLTPDAIKIMATGGVVSENPNSHKSQLSLKSMMAIKGQVDKMSMLF